MAVNVKTINFLKKSNLRYGMLDHRTVYTAYDKAATLKLKPSDITKTLVLKFEKEMCLAVLPGNKNLDKQKFKAVLNSALKKKGLKTAKNIDFVPEKAMKSKFKGIMLGAVPPLGEIWGMMTLIDKAAVKRPLVIINCGDYEHSLKLKTKDFLKLFPDVITGNFSKSK